MTDLNLSIGVSAFVGTDASREALDAVKAAGIKEIDTAHLYGSNEVDLGNADIAKYNFDVSSKNRGGFDSERQALIPENIIKTGHGSLETLKLKQLDIFYVHAPDRSKKVQDWMPSFQKLYEDGVFRRFGISNFSPEEVREVYEYNKSKGYVLPTVYQGNYNAISRHYETDLFPVLRELGISFYAYSPLAGGFFTKSRKDIEAGTSTGRYASEKTQVGAMYSAMYSRPSLLHVLDLFDEISQKEGVSKNDLAYRWVYYHSALKPELGDTLIAGASKVHQIGSSVEGLKKGPLSKEAADAINDIWDSVKADTFVDNFHFSQS